MAFVIATHCPHILASALACMLSLHRAFLILFLSLFIFFAGILIHGMFSEPIVSITKPMYSLHVVGLRSDFSKFIQNPKSCKVCIIKSL